MMSSESSIVEYTNEEPKIGAWILVQSPPSPVPIKATSVALSRAPTVLAAL